MMCRSLALAVVCVAATFSYPLFAQTAAPPVVTQPTQDKPWPPVGVVPMCHCDQDPVLLKDKKPNYPRTAMDARIQGAVEIEAVVQPNGSVGEVRVVRSLDTRYGLDDEAVKAAKQWKFKPLKAKDGKPAPVLVTMELSFWLPR